MADLPGRGWAAVRAETLTAQHGFPVTSQRLHMTAEQPTQEQLLAELATLRQEVATLQAACQRADIARQESEERYRALFNNADDILYTLDLNGRILSV